jgi:hypothetical protein
MDPGHATGCGGGSRAAKFVLDPSWGFCCGGGSGQECRCSLRGSRCAGMGLAFVVPTLAANPAARVGHPALLFGRRRQEEGCATRPSSIPRGNFLAAVIQGHACPCSLGGSRCPRMGLHLWFPPLPQTRRQGYSTRICSLAEEDKKKGAPPAAVRHSV